MDGIQCLFDHDCGRINYCAHQYIFSPDPSQIVGLVAFSVFTGLSLIGGFGIAPPYVFILLLWLNYTRMVSFQSQRIYQKETASLIQPTLIGFTLIATIMLMKIQHPLRNSPIIDFKLVALVSPPLCVGLLGGIYIRNFAPLILLSIFTALQFLMIVLVQIFRVRQASQINDTQKKVNEDVLKSEKKEENKEIEENKDDIAYNDDIMATITQFHNQLDTVQVDIQELFIKIQKSKYSDLYLKYLPQQLLDEAKLYDEKSKKFVTAREFFQIQLNDQKNLVEPTKSIIIYKITVFKVKLSKEDLVKVYKNYHFPRPILEFILTSITTIVIQFELQYFFLTKIKFNVLCIVMLTRAKDQRFAKIAGGRTCFSNRMWLLLGVEFIGNVFLFVVYIFVLKRKENNLRQQFIISVMEYLQNSQFTEQQRKELKEMHGEKSSLSNPRMFFLIDLRNTSIIFFSGLLGGFMLGFAGICGGLISMMLLAKLQISVKSLAATLPVLFMITSISGTLLQILLDIMDWETAAIFILLAIGSIAVFVPIFRKLYDRFKLRMMSFKCAIGNLQVTTNYLKVLQLIISGLYIYRWIGSLQNDMSKQTELRARNTC